MISEKEYQKLLEIVKSAGKIVTGATAIEDGHHIKEKAGTANFVTTYDVSVQTYLLKELTAVYPDALFLAEEKENDISCLSAPHCFIIDPIDGTTNFIHGCHHSAISVAMAEGGSLTFAAILNPYTGELFHARVGHGAFCGDHPIHVSDRPLENALVAFGTCPYYKDTLSDMTFAILKDMFLTCGDVRRPGAAALDLAGVADGRNDIFFECILSPWDYAAGSLLIREAGGIITSMEATPLDLGRPTSVLAATPHIYNEALKIVQKHYKK